MKLRLLLSALAVAALLLAARQTRESVLTVHIIDASTGEATPARVTLRTSGGEPVTTPPEGAVPVMWGRSDRSEGFTFTAGGAFYADGEFSVPLEPGEYTLEVSKGNEFLRQPIPVEVPPGEALSRTVRLERWINMPERGWYSADDHIHLQRSPRDNPAVLRWIAAEDLHVGNILEMGDFFATYFTQYAFGEEGRYREGGHILSPGQEEPRTPEIGHTISLGADEFVRFRDDYYHFGRVFDRVQELNGISGFAHQATTFHGYRGMVLTALAGKVDFIELVQFCAADGPLVTDHYYHFLDLGIPLTALAGSDFPWCGLGPRYGIETGSSQIGDARFYTYLGGALTFDNWLENVKAGHTFATTGPVLELTVNGQLPGDRIEVARGERLSIRARALGHAEQVPLSALEVVVHGEVVSSTSGSAESLVIETELPVERGVWIAARARAGKFQYAHTTPVYVSVDGGGFENPATLTRNVELAEEYLQQIEAELAEPGTRMDNQAVRHRQALEEQIVAARGELAGLLGR